ncbi:PAS domain-containing sensor histidine kinase [Desulfogranum marinum]|uniref:PAS domain-containing sensor histidine kinase n=1 Tax=Desulfogranum marinum TaxID=453220 RepID=UPI00196384AC|nr:PAS domain-containing protein [Desulfogranum marinum]MBM9513698.1 PAS domain-containing protein [Desulfogranum marinum]
MPFETLLFDISSRYINLPADQIDTCIEEDQQRICEWFDLDLSSLWQWENINSKYMILTHLYSAQGRPDHPDRIDAHKVVPWIMRKVEKGEPFILSTKDIGTEAKVDQQFREAYGVKSSVIIPLVVGRAAFHGVVSFDTLRDERLWTKQTINRLVMVSQIFSSALARKVIDTKLRNNEARLRIAADSADADLWELDMITEELRATDKALEMTSNALDKIDTIDSLKQIIHPDDLDTFSQAISRSFEQHRQLKIEYRIVPGSDSPKWIYSMGKPYFRADGTPDRLLGLSIDITKRKKMEDELKVSRKRLAVAIDIAELGFYEMGENYQIVFLDERMRSFLGIPRGAKVNPRQFWLENIHEGDLFFVKGAIQAVTTEGTDHLVLDYRYRHPQRGVIYLHHLSNVLQRDETGRANRIIGVLRDVTETKRAEEALQVHQQLILEHKKELQQLTGRLISDQEEELRRLSRELHDDLTQRLAVLAIEAGKLELQMNTLDSTFADYVYGITRIKEQLIRISEDVHRLSRQLHPTIINDLGLIHAVKIELDAFMKQSMPQITFTHENIPDTIDQDIALCLYRFIQEGLRNIASHSKADKCELFLRYADQIFDLTLQDNGKGFHPKEVKSKLGLGLSSMRERVQFVHGEFFLDSAPGQGTSIRACIPHHKGEE